MKNLYRFLILTLLLIPNNCGYTQSISIELSVTWEMEKDDFQRDSVVSTPKLLITYRNLSQTKLYFLKITKTRMGYPQCYGDYSIHNFPIDRETYYKEAISHDNHTGKSYHVFLGESEPLYSSIWLLKNDTLTIENPQTYELINDDLADIYEYLYRERSPKYYESIESSFTYFRESDITGNKINKIIKDRFVFLKPGETYIDEYNLIGFKLLGGKYTFFIDQTSLFDYVLTEPIWDKLIGSNFVVKIMLPKEVNGYMLYSGKFYTNQISISF